MLIFTYAYVLLALASWSALAVPLFGPDKGNGNSHMKFFRHFVA